MIRMAICSKEPELLEELYNHWRGILTKLKTDYRIKAFPSAQELGWALEAGAKYNLLCMDVNTPVTPGMEAEPKLELEMKLARTMLGDGIALISGRLEAAREGYDARLIQMLRWPASQELLERALGAELHLHHQTTSITVRSGGKETVLPLKEIRFIESRNHGCVFNMEQGEQFFWMTLAQVQEMLPENAFCRCHNSFLVNLKQIQEVSSREILMRDGETLSIGARYAQRFHEAFAQYMGE